MQPVIFDTSVWIDYLNGVKNSQANLLNEYIENDQPLLICPVIIQEILQGISTDKDFENIKDSLLSFEILNISSLEAAIGAAQLYRQLRKKGITINKSNDCLIAFYAIRFDVGLIHKDSDFDKIAKQSSLKIIKP
jgi:predicted nucleic acid-binding protein